MKSGGELTSIFTGLSLLGAALGMGAGINSAVGGPKLLSQIMGIGGGAAGLGGGIGGLASGASGLSSAAGSTAQAAGQTSNTIGGTADALSAMTPGINAAAGMSSPSPMVDTGGKQMLFAANEQPNMATDASYAAPQMSQESTRGIAPPSPDRVPSTPYGAATSAMALTQGAGGFQLSPETNAMMASMGMPGMAGGYAPPTQSLWDTWGKQNPAGTAPEMKYGTQAGANSALMDMLKQAAENQKKQMYANWILSGIGGVGKGISAAFQPKMYQEFPNAYRQMLSR